MDLDPTLSEPDGKEEQAKPSKSRKRNRVESSPVVKVKDEFKDYGINAPRTVGAGVVGAPGEGTRFVIGEFKTVLTKADHAVRTFLHSPPFDFSKSDIDCEALRYQSPKHQIAHVIENALQNPEFDEMEPQEIESKIEIPDFENLVENERSSDLHSVQHIEFVRKHINKVRNKTINYLAKPLEAVTYSGNLLEEGEILISVSLFQPKTNTKVQEYLVYGSQKLSELRDKLYCVQDKANPAGEPKPDYQNSPKTAVSSAISSSSSTSANVPSTSSSSVSPVQSPSRTIRISLPNSKTNRRGSVGVSIISKVDPSTQQSTIQSNTSNLSPEQVREKQLEKSGFFFIEDTFYNDTRSEYCVDMSETFVEWALSGESPYWKSRNVKTQTMENTTFADLFIRIGQRYLYFHRGNCEHGIVFTSVRAMTEHDERHISAYPMKLFQAKLKQRKCLICENNVAKLVTWGDSFAIEDPAYFCQGCFEITHGKMEDAVKRAGFTVYPYLHDS